jgi:hypothetical protein
MRKSFVTVVSVLISVAAVIALVLAAGEAFIGPGY